MIYADYNSSAPICPEVKKYLNMRLEKGPFANPNAIHILGNKTHMAMEKARIKCAEVLDCEPHQIIFTSGATEGISTILHSVLSQSLIQNKPYVILSSIEHSAVANSAKYYETLGHKILIAPVDNNGVLKLDELQKLCEEYKNKISLICVMAANNETGVIQPWQQVVQIAKNYSIPYFSDTTQYIGKTEFSFKESDLDFAVMSGHKIGALGGTGILLAKNPKNILPIIIGGGQERGYRGGTQHYIGNETLAVALDYFNHTKQNFSELEMAKNEFEAKIKKDFPAVVIIGLQAKRLATTTYIAYPGIHGQAVQIELESQNIFVSTSSACSDNSPVTSKVLRAMGIEDNIGRGVVRISLGSSDPISTYQEIYLGLKNAYTKLSRVSSY